MVPTTKTPRRKPHAGPTTSSAPTFKARPTEERDASGIPGISKLKSSIRQTKRLLAKDTIEPGLKIATERRLRSLEADLMKAERRDLERKNGGKYHMVKFFERQKLCRIIKRLQKTINSSSSPPSSTIQELENARIMLNYIIHYPNDKKYIALFPTTLANSSEGTKAKSKSKLPDLIPDSKDEVGGMGKMENMEKGEKKRSEMLLETKRMMGRGELSGEPEKGEGKGMARVTIAAAGKVDDAGGKKDKVVEDEVEEDDFFESD